MSDLRALFGGVGQESTEKLDISPEAQLREAIISAGLMAPSSLVFDSKIHRFRSDPKKRGRSGWYVAHLDGGKPAGAFGCWRSGVSESWHAVGAREMTAAEEAEYRRWLQEVEVLRAAEEQRRHELAADVVEEIWDAAPEADDSHPYLVKKGVKAHGCRLTGDGRLIAPMFDIDGNLSSLQYIEFVDGAGVKQYHSGGAVRGAFWVLGELTAEGGAVYVAEGFATAATIHEVTGRPTVVAFSAYNLDATAGAVRKLLGDHAELVVVADNDKGGQGLRHAEQATANHGGRYVMPPLLGDANDYRAAGRDLAALLTPTGHPAKSWLVRATDFAAQPAPLAWLVEGWIQANAMMMVHGPSGHGKTFVVLDWCLRMASGVGDWRGCAVEPGDVVYLAGEGHHGLRGRIAAWQAHHGALAHRMWVSESGCDLDKQDGLRKAIDAITAWGVRPALIVVDTLHRFLSGDENSAQDAREMLDSCAELMGAFGGSVLLVHHTGNNEDNKGRARGSSAWRGALDTETSVCQSEADKSVIVISQRKSKDAEMQPDLHAALAKVEIPGWLDKKGQPVTSAIVVAEHAPAKRPKADKVIEGHRRTWEAAWWSSGAETRDGAPYLSRSALEQHLTKPEGGNLRVNSAAQAIKPAGTGIVAKLLAAGFMEPKEHGWTVIDENTRTALLLAR